MSKKELKKLAKLVFELTRREVWLGGQGPKNYWPKNINWNWNHRTYWTLSPEVELGGHRVRVCIFMRPTSDNRIPAFHTVTVLIDDQEKHPGGRYTVTNPWFFHNWSSRIAYQEMEEGGKTGPVDTRDLLIQEAEQKLKTPRVSHQQPLLDFNSPEAKAAEAEINALLTKARSVQSIKT